MDIRVDEPIIVALEGIGGASEVGLNLWAKVCGANGCIIDISKCEMLFMHQWFEDSLAVAVEMSVEPDLSHEEKLVILGEVALLKGLLVMTTAAIRGTKNPIARRAESHECEDLLPRPNLPIAA